MISSFTDFISNTGGSSNPSLFNFSNIFGNTGQQTGMSSKDISLLSGLASLAFSPAGFNLAPGLFGGQSQPVGYQGGIPDYKFVRKRVPNTYDPNRRPGSGGQRYFTDARFVNMDPNDQEMGGASNRLSQENLFAAEEAHGLFHGNTYNPAREEIKKPVEILSDVAPSVALPASGVASVLPVPTYTMASEFPAPVPEGGIQTMATGGTVQEQARKDAEALGISLDEYYAMPFKERLGLAVKDIGEVFNPSLGPLLQNPNNVDPKNARSLGILSLPKPPAPAPVPEITQEILPKAPVSQPTTTANRPESLTLEDQMGINQERMTTYPTGAGIGPEMRNEDFMAQLELINQGKPPAPKGEAVPSIRTGPQTGVPPKPKLRLHKDTAKNQRERREWDKKYGDMYNDDGTLKIDSESFLEQLLKILGAGFGRGQDRVAAAAKEAATKGLATGGMLDGATDGMADKVPAMIDNENPAALSDGEYVITADVVGHLGNGNSDAGAKVLDDFMGDVRMARTNTRKQAPEINPQKFLPKV